MFCFWNFRIILCLLFSFHFNWYDLILISIIIFFFLSIFFFFLSFSLLFFPFTEKDLSRNLFASDSSYPISNFIAVIQIKLGEERKWPESERCKSLRWQQIDTKERKTKKKREWKQEKHMSTTSNQIHASTFYGWMHHTSMSNWIYYHFVQNARYHFHQCINKMMKHTERINDKNFFFFFFAAIFG